MLICWKSININTNFCINFTDIWIFGKQLKEIN